MSDDDEFFEILGLDSRSHEHCAVKQSKLFGWKSGGAADRYIERKCLGENWQSYYCRSCELWHIGDVNDEE